MNYAELRWKLSKAIRMRKAQDMQKRQKMQNYERYAKHR